MGSFSLAARHLECRACGAPLAASPGAQVRCQFCGSEYLIEGRSEDGRGALSAADDIARLSRLRAQLEHPIEGHLYDLDEAPPGASARGVHAGADADSLERLWSELKPRALAGEDSQVDQHALCWLAIRLGRRLLDAGDAEGARVKLETALDLLRDPGHRHLVRCALAEAAVEVGELDAAEGWLRECDQAAEVLELDTALRWARVRLCLARGLVGDALALVGASAQAVPAAREYGARFELARVELDERAGKLSGAETRMRAAYETHGPHLLTAAERLDLAGHSAHKLGQEMLAARCEKALGELHEISGTRALIRGALLRGPLLALLFSLLLGIVGCSTHRGPLLGATSDFTCARACDSCQGPYTMEFWSSSNGTNSSSHHVVLCQTPTSSAEDWDFGARTRASYQGHEQVLPGGTWTLWGLSYLMLLPFTLLVGLLLSWRSRAAKASRARELEAEIEGLQTKLEHPVVVHPPGYRGPLLWLVVASVPAVLFVVINLLLR